MTIEQPPPIDEDPELDRANDEVFKRPVSQREREYFTKPSPKRSRA